MSDPDEWAVAEALAAKHAAAAYSEYGRCIAAGYTVTAGSNSRTRVTHVIPDPDLLDEERPSDDTLAAERHRKVAEYAACLTGAGWNVEEGGILSRRPYLLVRPTA